MRPVLGLQNCESSLPLVKHYLLSRGQGHTFNDNRHNRSGARATDALNDPTSYDHGQGWAHTAGTISLVVKLTRSEETARARRFPMGYLLAGEREMLTLEEIQYQREHSIVAMESCAHMHH